MDEGKRLAVGTIHFPISKLPTCWRDWHFFDFIISYFQLLPFRKEEEGQQIGGKCSFLIR
jgi:hypothetical protein